MAPTNTAAVTIAYKYSKCLGIHNPPGYDLVDIFRMIGRQTDRHDLFLTFYDLSFQGSFAVRLYGYFPAAVDFGILEVDRDRFF